MNLFFFQKYQEHLNKTGLNKQSLDSAITLLQHTTTLTSLFNDKLHITSVVNDRLKKLQDFYCFMTKWSVETKANKKQFVSDKLWLDLQSMCLGFRSMVMFKLRWFPNSVVKPAIVNQDCVENHFCQVRSCNGQNNNLTYSQQQHTQNSIRMGQTAISQNCNAAGKKKQRMCVM